MATVIVMPIMSRMAIQQAAIMIAGQKHSLGCHSINPAPMARKNALPTSWHGVKRKTAMPTKKAGVQANLSKPLMPENMYADQRDLPILTDNIYTVRDSKGEALIGNVSVLANSTKHNRRSLTGTIGHPKLR